MNKKELAKRIYEVSHLTGNFRLRSGKYSKEYSDKYLFESDPSLLNEIASHLTKIIPDNIDILAGLEMGGIPIATSLSLKTGIPVVFVRKKPKEYGTCKLAEGINVKNKKICIVEDIVTTGGQIIKSTEELRKLGSTVNDVICVLVRDKTAYANLADAKLELSSLFEMDDLIKQ